MKKPGYLLYGIFSQIVSIGSLVYFSFWVYRTGVSKTIDSGVPGNPVTAFAVDTILLGIFCLAHSLLARTSVKQWTRRFVPHLLERTTYCLLFGVLLLGVCFAWQPLPEIVWRITSPAGVTAIFALFLLSWIAHFGAIFWMGYGEFFGLRQMWLAAHGEDYRQPAPMTQRDFAISHVTLVISLMVIPWATPAMSVGQLYYCIFLAVYDLIGAWFSSRDLSDVPAPVPNAGSSSLPLSRLGSLP
ncbi:MAG: hypothetical protein WAM82_17920 [Thermoanaerobaculia bacterium]